MVEFAETLSNHGIASLTFHKEVSKKSLISFFQLLALPPEEAAGEHGIQQELANQGSSHIDIVTVDYNLFQLSEKDGQTVAGATKSRGHRNANATWIRFTNRLIRGGFEDSDESDLGSNNEGQSAAGGDPVRLANFINENKLNIAANLNSYGAMLDGMLASTISQHHDAPAESQETAEPSCISGAESSMVVTMLDELNPALRRQFLATTLDKCQKNIKNNPSRLLSQLSSKLIYEMEDIANEAGREISPALLSLIQGLSTDPGIQSLDDVVPSSPHEIKTLMAREQYEDYVDPDYDALLQLLGKNKKPIEPPVGFVLEEEENTFTDPYLASQTSQLMLALMENTESEEEYSRYGQKLIEVALDLPSLGNFSQVETISDTLVRHASNHPSLSIQELAKDCLHRIEGREYVESIAALLPEASSRDKIIAVQALIDRGPQAVSELLDFYCDEKERSLKKKLERFFHSHRVETLVEIIHRVPRAKPITVLLLLDLAKQVGVGGAAPLLHPLLSRHDDSIRMTTLELLLPLQDREAVQYLRDMLQSSDESAVLQALTLAWKHKTAPLLADIIALLNYHCLKKKTIQRNSRIILALSGLGDASALPALEKLATSTLLFHANEIKKMKEALFLSLTSYPLNSVLPLCKKGLSSKQQEIREICSSILARAEKGRQR